MRRVLNGWILARAPASPPQGLQRHGLRYYNSSYVCVALCFSLQKKRIVELEPDECLPEKHTMTDQDRGGQGDVCVLVSGKGAEIAHISRVTLRTF